MDPVTAILNAYTATLSFVSKVIDKAPAEDVGAIIVKHEARMDKLWGLMDKFNSDLGKLFKG